MLPELGKEEILVIYEKGEMIGRTLKTEKARSSTLVLDSDNCNFEESQSNKFKENLQEK